MEIKKTLAGIVLPTALFLGGCTINPEPGKFRERIPIAFPSHPVIMALFAGEYRCSKIEEAEKITGIDIKRMHWLLGETANPQIYLPKDAGRMGMDEFLGSFWVSYDLAGKRRLDKYNVGDNKEAKLAEQYIVDGKNAVKKR